MVWFPLLMVAVIFAPAAIDCAKELIHELF